MIDTIAACLVALARLAVIAYSVKQGRDVIVHWLDRMATQPATTQIVDLARREGVDLHALAEEQRTV